MSIQTVDRPASSALFTDAESAPAVSWRRESGAAIGSAAMPGHSRPVMIPFAGGELVFSEAPPDWFLPIIERIRALHALAENWDSYGGRPVNAHCAATAISLLLNVLEPNMPEPAVVPTNGGGLQIEWHRDAVDIEIEVQSPSRLYVAFEDEKTGEQWEKQISGDLHLPVPLLARLAAMK
ncbi:MAG: hypothetical protein FJ276_26300 [Planctomycetes bacterium]|nr:hypothetical protein [Planctomycetota bacterium]